MIFEYLGNDDSRHLETLFLRSFLALSNLCAL